jgi:hypothetical protein
MDRTKNGPGGRTFVGVSMIPTLLSLIFSLIIKSTRDPTKKFKLQQSHATYQSRGNPQSTRQSINLFGWNGRVLLFLSSAHHVVIKRMSCRIALLYCPREQITRTIGTHESTLFASASAWSAHVPIFAQPDYHKVPPKDKESNHIEQQG